MIPDISVVVPVHDEQGAAGPLAREIAAAFEGRAYEMVFVDDASRDGTGLDARFSAITAMAMDPTDNLIVVDRGASRIRKISSRGVVTTLSGSGSGAFADGTGAAASFNSPHGVAVIPSTGVIVVADYNNHRIRLVTPLGVVTTLAGSGNT